MATKAVTMTRTASLRATAAARNRQTTMNANVASGSQAVKNRSEEGTAKLPETSDGCLTRSQAKKLSGALHGDRIQSTSQLSASRTIPKITRNKVELSLSTGKQGSLPRNRRKIEARGSRKNIGAGSEVNGEGENPSTVEMETEYQNRMEVEDEVDPNALTLLQTKGNCGYCGVDLNELEGVILRSCCHIFCRECLASSIELQDTVELVCPQGCGGRLLEKEIKALCTREVYRRWEERGMAAARAALGGCAVQCYMPGCPGWAEMDNIEARRIFMCPFCSKQNCLKCKAVHDGVTCEEYAELKTKAAATGENVNKLIAKLESRGGFSQLRNQMVRSKQRQSMGTFLNKELLHTATEIECSICFGDIAPGDGIILHECLHTFCKKCIIDLIKHSDTQEVRCPYIDNNFTCTFFLSQREIKALAPKKIYDGWLEKSVKLAEGAIVNSVHCKTIDCPGWVEIEDIENAVGAFACTVCQKTNCLQCKAIHEGISCDDYKNRLVQNDNDKKSEDALNAMVAKGECMRCPKCKTFVEKLVGCDWLMCSCCRTELCWATKGPRWGPKGKGDTTGGCKCEYYRPPPLPPGKKCAPNCQNCH